MLACWRFTWLLLGFATPERVDLLDRDTERVVLLSMSIFLVAGLLSTLIEFDVDLIIMLLGLLHRLACWLSCWINFMSILIASSIAENFDLLRMLMTWAACGAIRFAWQLISDHLHLSSMWRNALTAG